MVKNRADIYNFAQKVVGAIFSVDITNFKIEHKKKTSKKKTRIYRKRKLKLKKKKKKRMDDNVIQINNEKLEDCISCILYFIYQKYEDKIDKDQLNEYSRFLKNSIKKSIFQVIPTVRKLLYIIDEDN